MDFQRLPGSSRSFIDLDTGKIYSRRQHDKIVQGIVSFEQKAAKNLAENPEAALSRPARGRSKARTKAEAKRRVAAREEAEEIKRTVKLEKLAAKKSARIKLKKVTPQLLKTGHFSRRIPFRDYDQFLSLIHDAQKLRVRGKKVIEAYSLGVTGYSTNDRANPPKLFPSTISTKRSIIDPLDEDEFDDLTDDFLETKSYYILSHYWIQLTFTEAYGQQRIREKNRKNLPPKRKA